MKINLKRAVDNLSKKNLNFFQPMYEAITNSLEAGATRIEINILDETTFDGITAKIKGYSIVDNGEGFTNKNIESFLELWSDKKLEFGCKGSGRFTWLSVFSNIHIQSEVASENKYVDFFFNTDFSDEKICVQSKVFANSKTIISFSDVGKRFFDAETGFDNRDIADIDLIKNAIECSMNLKLFLMKKERKCFSIVINVGDKQVEINEKTIPELDQVDFKIRSEVTDVDYGFELYYHFIEDGQNSKKIYYCAAGRTVKEETDESLRINELPGKVSYNMLLCSKYLSERVNDSRDDFPDLSNRKQASLDCPLLYRDINRALLKQLHTILINKYPLLEEVNKEQERKAIDAAPFLTKYIKENKDIIKTEQSLIKDGLKAFNAQKNTAKEKFEKLLKEKSINTEKFNQAVTEISEVALAELGEYILYRESIIKALEEAISDTEKKEKFIHDIFMPMRTVSHEEDKDKCYLSNFWLLDDKFMTYSYAASDMAVEAIKRDIELKNEQRYKEKNRPDLAIFFNKIDGHKNLIIAELKGANASENEKNKALTELPNDVAIIKKHIPDVDTIWSYIITTIDDNFKATIENQGEYIELFSADNIQLFYYKY